MNFAAIRRLRHIALALLAISLVSATSAAGQSPKSPSSDVSTKYERFAAKKGVVTIRTFYDVTPFHLGPLHSYEVQGVVLAHPGEAEKTFAVVFTRNDPQRVRPMTAVLDFDEAVSLLEALTMLTKIAADLKGNPSQPYTEALFSTRAGFEVGLFQAKGEQKAYLSLEHGDTASSTFGTLGLFDEVRSAVNEAVDKLRTAGAQ